MIEMWRFFIWGSLVIAILFLLVGIGFGCYMLISKAKKEKEKNQLPVETEVAPEEAVVVAETEVTPEAVVVAETEVAPEAVIVTEAVVEPEAIVTPRKNIFKSKRVIIASLTSALLAIIVIIGIANSQASKQTRAIEVAIKEANKSSSEYCYMTADDIKKQIKKQRTKDSKKAEYTIEVAVPDALTIKDKAVEIKEPSYNLRENQIETYSKEYIRSETKRLKRKITGSKRLKSKKENISVKLVENDNKWKATINESDIEKISEMLNVSISKKAEKMLKNTEGYKKLKVVDEIYAELHKTFLEEDYCEMIDIESLEKKSKKDSYEIILKYPDPGKFYITMDEILYNKYAEKGRVNYLPITSEDLLNELYINSEIRMVLELTEINSPKLETPLSENEEYITLSKAVTEKRTEKIGGLLERINNDFVIPMVEKPATGIVSGESHGESLRISVTPDFTDIYIIFYALSGEDINEDGTPVLSTYIRAGESITIRLPAGNYKLFEAMGTDWYGTELAYGPYGRYQIVDELFKIESNYEYSLVISGNQESNMSTKNVPFPFGQ